MNGHEGTREDTESPDDLGVSESADGSAYLLWSRTGRTVSWCLVAKAGV